MTSIRTFPQRFNLNVETKEEAVHYFENRSKQLAMGGFCLHGIDNNFEGAGWGTRVFFQGPCDQLYQSVYVYSSFRGKGLLGRWAKARQPWDMSFVTSPGCGLYRWFKQMGIPCHLAGTHTAWTEYQAIETLYGDTKAERSGIFYMNHIDEGLWILNQIGASNTAMRAFCLHPAVQQDHDLFANEDILSEICCNPRTLAYAMEYRSVANEYLSPKESVTSASEIRLSSIPDVNDMLVADKIQNYKDFILYHKDAHPRSGYLDRYFKLWLERLGVSESQFKEFFLKLCRI